jgi:hypothetical protein
MKRFVMAVFAALLLMSSPAYGQSSARSERDPVGERYWVEFTATWWRPGLTGSVASDSLDLIGSTIDFAGDLGFGDSRTSDFRLVLRPARKHKFRFQYTPVEFSAASVLARDIAFAGQLFPVALPIESLLTWNVMRFGYEWDFFYRPRGFVGLLIEVRRTELTAAIDSLLASGDLLATAPLPALGLVGRVNPTRHLAVNFEVGGLKLSDFSPDHSFTSMDMEFSATYNVTRNVGVSGGWRRLNTSLIAGDDRGELDFKGLWFGGVVRY